MKMKKITILKVVGLLSITFIVLISAQSINDNEKIGKSYKDISSFGLNQFINMDLGLIGYFPKKEDWSQIDKKIKLVPIDSLRYIDSLDIHKLVDTLYVKIYSQNYAYQSSNTYKIAKNRNKSTDSLMIFNFNVDLRMKDIVVDTRSFRIKNFSVDYVVKQNIPNVDKRIIINKKFH
jgi:hypothetical protein